MTLREDADYIIKKALEAALPDEAVGRALLNKEFGTGRIRLVAVGKAAWQMAHAALQILGERIEKGIVITKYGHVQGELYHCRCFEAGHPVPDENSFAATEEALELVKGLKPQDTVLFLLSGGGSALFEKPLIPAAELESLTGQMLACGANIVEMNTIRKRLSAVKGGKFAALCSPALVYGVVLSDILGDPLDMIASGPAYPDSSTCTDARRILEKYQLHLSDTAMRFLEIETPKELDHIEMVITGSVRQLCEAAAQAALDLGYRPVYLTDCLDCEAREAGAFLGAIARSMQNSAESLAYIAGGETIVHLCGHGMGGRNQEVALSGAHYLSGCKKTAIFSLGSDGTDGPTDAAGGYADENTKELLNENGMDIYRILNENDAYHGLKASGGLIMTGPTGTNVNDLSVLLIKR